MSTPKPTLRSTTIRLAASLPSESPLRHMLVTALQETAKTGSEKTDWNSPQVKGFLKLLADDGKLHAYIESALETDAESRYHDAVKKHREPALPKDIAAVFDVRTGNVGTADMVGEVSAATKKAWDSLTDDMSHSDIDHLDPLIFEALSHKFPAAKVQKVYEDAWGEIDARDPSDE